MKEKYKNNFIYKVTNKDTLKSYIGKHSGNLEPLDDIGVVYFTSSYDTEFRNDFINNTGNYTIDILGNYDSSKKALELEVKLHEELDIAKNPLYYNKAKQTSASFDITGMNHSEETRALIGSYHQGKTLSTQHRKILSEANFGAGNPMWGKERPQYVKDAIGKAHSKPMTEEQKLKISKTMSSKKGVETSMYGKTHSKLTKTIMSKNNKGNNNPNYGKHWYNNGKINKPSKDHPGNGWVLGMLRIV